MSVGSLLADYLLLFRSHQMSHHSYNDKDGHASLV